MLPRFVAVVLVTAAALAGLNLAPAALGGEPLGVARYPSVRAVETRYHVRLWVPATAGPWRWPPRRVRVAAADPVWVEFVLDGTGTAGPLEICQTFAPASSSREAAVPEVLLPPGQRLQSAALDDGHLRRVMLEDGTIVNELWWRHGAGQVVLRARGTPDVLMGAARNRP